MTRKMLIALLWGALAVSVASADTWVPAGSVSGTWTAAGSPYWIQGDITVTAGNTLTIEPAVEVEFQGDYWLTVNGYLEAIGTEVDSIHFFPADTSVGWGGIRFMDAPDSSHLAYCTVRHAGTYSPLTGEGGIYCSNSNPLISHCTITNNRTTDPFHGGGIGIDNNAGPEISHCTITRNVAPYGGGIYIQSNTSQQAKITGCTISDNFAVSGGGICLYEDSNSIITDCIISNNSLGLGVGPYGGGGIYGNTSSTTLTNCVIRDHTIQMDGGGMVCEDMTATLINCTFSNNITTNDDSYGGGLACVYSGSSLTLSYCTFDSNKVMGYPAGETGGGAIGLEDGFSNTISVDHCTFYDNSANLAYGDAIFIGTSGQAEIHNSIFAENGYHGAIWVWSGGTLSAVTYSDFYGNATNIATGAPPGFGTITTTNYNGDPCDQYYNIFEEDPLFADPEAGNFQLTWANFPDPDTTKSPCIDAGDPAFALDPDGTITDMGPYFFDQRAPDIELSATSLDFGTVTVGSSADLPLIIYNTGDADLILSDLACALSVFSTNWDPADSLISPDDSLEVTVTFTPDDSTSYEDTLSVENNCEECLVPLAGTGEIILGIDNDAFTAIPDEFALREPYPNPFNPVTTFKVELPAASWVTIGVYDIAGRPAGSPLQEDWMPAGYHEVTFDASGLASGVYVYRLEAGEFRASGKMVLMK